jgi:alkyl hydroperoxide reductase subunit AhpF
MYEPIFVGGVPDGMKAAVDAARKKLNALLISCDIRAKAALQAHRYLRRLSE